MMCIKWATISPLLFIDLNPFLFNHRRRISCSSCGRHEHEFFIRGLCVPGCFKGIQKEIIELFRGLIGVQCYPQVRRVSLTPNVHQLNSHHWIETSISYISWLSVNSLTANLKFLLVDSWKKSSSNELEAHSENFSLWSSRRKAKIVFTETKKCQVTEA